MLLDWRKMAKVEISECFDELNFGCREAGGIVS